MDSAGGLPSQAFYQQISNSVSGQITLYSSSFPKKASAGRLLILREVKNGDEVIAQKILADPENSKDDLSIVNCSSDELLAIAKLWTTHTEPLSSFQFVISVAGEPIGLAGFGWIGSGTNPDLDLVESDLVGVAGVIVNPSARGQGYGFEVLKMVIDYGLRDLKLSRVVVGTTSRNTAMRRLMEERFNMPAVVTKPDRFGNDLEWNITRDTWAAWLMAHNH